MKYTGISLQTLLDTEINFLLENINREGSSSVMENSHVKSDEIKKILYIDANNLFGQAMSQLLQYEEIKFDEEVNLEDT